MVWKILGSVALIMGFMYFFPAPNSYGEKNPIEGSFGYTLGQVYNPPSPFTEKRLQSDDFLYEVQPLKPVAFFQKYELLLTPETHLIAEIRASGHYASEEHCNQKLKVLQSILSDKYGTFTSPYLTVNTYKVLTDQNRPERKITLQCSGFLGGYTLSLSYKDTSLENQAAHEEGQSIDKIDNSAL